MVIGAFFSAIVVFLYTMTSQADGLVRKRTKAPDSINAADICDVFESVPMGDQIKACRKGGEMFGYNFGVLCY